MTLPTAPDRATRTESDLLGSLALPADAYWGIHTERARANFDSAATPVAAMPTLIVALAEVKLACARANQACGVLPAALADAIVAACERVRGGALHEQFVVDVLQGGAGTSTNMNANEVLANAALESLGLARGRYDVVHPNDHVNASQSTNDVYPSALRLALWRATAPLLNEIQQLGAALARQAATGAEVLKIGRTQLQDAVPMTVGQEIGAWARSVQADRAALAQARLGLLVVNLGGTAIGTGVNAPEGFGARAVAELAELTGLPLLQAADLVHAGQDTAAFIDLSAALRRIAVHLGKIANDLRLLGSGPQAGFGDLRLPPRQAGSSIMPGKVNPVIPEMVNQVAFDVIGGDLTVTLACEAGQLQLNAFEPLIGWTLHRHAQQLARALAALRRHCIDGLQPDAARLAERVATSATLATTLAPYIGYAAASQVAKQALASRRSVVEVVATTPALSAEALAQWRQSTGTLRTDCSAAD